MLGEDVQGKKYRFNADIVISGEENMVQDWVLKVVFSKPISDIQVWEAVLGEKSSDGHVYIFRPHPWNANLRDDFSFLIIPEMTTETSPLGRFNEHCKISGIYVSL